MTDDKLLMTDESFAGPDDKLLMTDESFYD